MTEGRGQVHGTRIDDVHEDAEAGRLGHLTDALQQLSPQNLMTMLTSSDVARGTFVADEDLDGTAVKHYRISGESAFTLVPR